MTLYRLQCAGRTGLGCREAMTLGGEGEQEIPTGWQLSIEPLRVGSFTARCPRHRLEPLGENRRLITTVTVDEQGVHMA